MAEEIKYSDGSIENEILALVQHADTLGSEQAIAVDRYHEWPVRYHLCPERSNLVRHLDFSGLDVLEIGAGMGAVSRFIAENAASLTVIEGTQLRLDTLKARLRDLTNVTALAGNLEHISLEKKFDVVCAIGVLEYSELFMKAPDDGGTAFDRFLKIATGLLKEEGVLIVAIENKLGLKYWSGAAEDHSGGMFDGICGYPRTPTAKTFSQHELVGLFEAHGLTKIDRYYPFPDYKVPVSVMSSEFIESAPDVAANLGSHQAFENYGLPRVTHFPEILALKNVADSGLMEQFSNSFLFVASRKRDSVVRKHCLKAQVKRKEVAWHYSLRRKIPTKTIFHLNADQIFVRKRAMHRTKSVISESPDGMEFHWEPLPPTAVNRKPNLRFLLAREAYFGNRVGFLNYLEKFFNWAFETWVSEEGAWALSGEALDATVPNITCEVDATGFEVFDLEWRYAGQLSKTWFVFRSLFGLFREVPLLSDLGFLKLREVYEVLCARCALIPDFERDLELESQFQHAVTFNRGLETLRAELHSLFDTPFINDLPKSPAVESTFKGRLRALEIESAVWNAPAHRLMRKATESLKKVGPLHNLLRGAVELALTTRRS
jgi:2-polyprenyl-3-methyl-5-hydroxy-6-metoxy-1,4-benzoquinol methylase